MKIHARGTCVVWGVLLILLFGLGSRCFAGDDLAKRWFYRIFFVMSGLDSPLDRLVYIEFCPGSDWGFRHYSWFEN